MFGLRTRPRSNAANNPLLKLRHTIRAAIADCYQASDLRDQGFAPIPPTNTAFGLRLANTVNQFAFENTVFEFTFKNTVNSNTVFKIFSPLKQWVGFSAPLANATDLGQTHPVCVLIFPVNVCPTWETRPWRPLAQSENNKAVAPTASRVPCSSSVTGSVCGGLCFPILFATQCFPHRTWSFDGNTLSAVVAPTQNWPDLPPIPCPVAKYTGKAWNDGSAT